MFSEKKTTTSKSSLDINRISKNTKIVGDITSEGDFRIDGTIEGNVKTSGKIIIGKEGLINGVVHCASADIEGTFTGALVATSQLTLRSTAVVSGEVNINKLDVEPGAVFNASCEMKTGVKGISNGKQKAEKTA